MQLAALGLFVFELATLPFSELQRRSEWRHARNPRVGARDAVQFVGPGSETISITGALLPEAAGSFAAIETLREMADQGEPWSFIDGTGRIWGTYTIEHLDERKRYFLDNGVARYTDFAIDLARAEG